MDPQDKDAIELEVRRVLATHEIELRKLWSTGATGFREFLQGSQHLLWSALAYLCGFSRTASRVRRNN